MAAAKERDNQIGPLEPMNEIINKFQPDKLNYCVLTTHL